jgi:N-acetylgalactosamine-6-sulfatase
MDTRIGDLLQTLESRQMDQRTVVIFASDNGGTRSARNAPFSGTKGSTFEGGIRVPAIVRWPGVVPSGAVSDQPCITFDFTASIARITGVRPSPETPFEGMDIIKHVAENRQVVDRTLYWRKPRGDTIWKGLRQGSLKYIGHKRGDSYREYLFDLSADPAEKKNLQQERSEDFRRFKAMYDQWEDNVRRNR